MSAEAEPSVLDAFCLDGKVALVTGGGTGLGRSVAQGFADVGASVIVLGRRHEPLEQTVELIGSRGGTATALQADLRDAAGMETVFDEVAAVHGRLDVLVNNAGVTVVKPSVELTIDEWDHIHDVNLRGVFFSSAAAVRHFREVGGGVIVNIASIGALQGGSGVYSAYSAAKGGVVSLTRSLASEWARDNVRVNVIAAGAFPTEMSRGAYEDPKIHERYVRRIPRGRTGNLSEIAPLAVYLASPASDFVTGETFVIDGGQVMK